MPPSDTERDQSYIVRLRDYYVDARRIPSKQRIAELLGCASKAAAKKLLEHLEKTGFVKRTLAYPLIRTQGQLEIFGVVTGLIRSYPH